MVNKNQLLAVARLLTPLFAGNEDDTQFDSLSYIRLKPNNFIGV